MLNLKYFYHSQLIHIHLEFLLYSVQHIQLQLNLIKIVEDNEIIFEIKTNAYSREQAQNIVENWKKNATNLYPKLLGLLTKNNED